MEVRIQKSEDRMPAKNFQDLLVWQKSHKLVLEIYKLTSQFPKEEIYGLTSQIRRAAVSVPANITEGFKRKGKADKARFFNIAQASLEEVRYFLILTKDLNYAETNAIQERSSEISKMLTRYIKSILNS